MFKIFFLNFLIINLLFSLDFPSYVAEKEFLIENFNSIERWVFPKDINFELIKDKKDKFLKINYKFKEKHQELEIIYNFLYPGFDGERIGFKFKGDGSKNKIYVWGAYQNHWYPFTFFELKKEWQKIEIAPSPFYFFYKPVTKIKFVLKNLEKKENQGEFLIGKIYLITPEIFFSKLQPLEEKSFFPKKIFNTWGALSSLDNIDKKSKLLKEIGINLHAFPISFELENIKKLNEELDEICEKIKIIKKNNGILVGISFYNTPNPELISKYEKFLLKNENGEYYKTGGCFFSIWNPLVKKMWRDHILYSLKYLKKKNVLDSIDVVFLCPGEESEISYQWDHVWAFDEYAIESYRNYLKKLYRNRIENLNADWLTYKKNFKEILPPVEFYPDREHWVFLNFYRWSMLKWCCELSNYVVEFFKPKFFLWLPHTIGEYPKRFYSARFPHFYIWYLKKFNFIHMVHIPALDWHKKEDIDIIKPLNIKVIGEIDVIPSLERLELTFEQSKKYGFDGSYIGVAENLFNNGELSEVGEKCKTLIEIFGNSE